MKGHFLSITLMIMIAKEVHSRAFVALRVPFISEARICRKKSKSELLKIMMDNDVLLHNDHDITLTTKKKPHQDHSNRIIHHAYKQQQ